ncbi:hypothetical protein [Aquimarina aquimarini]|uniref:hypothetical protein n=1 Tax=Aquimarina aquimarini TaxID=1191734 RepID=UPI000D561360|nr:hypothetical protein [Aquimarina aquimarini]
MYKKLFSSIILFPFFVFSQDKPEEKNIHLDNVVVFGKYIEKEIILPNERNLILDVILKRLPKKYSKRFYNSNDSSRFDKLFDTIIDKKVTWKQKEKDKNKHVLIIPPLKPNYFYQVCVKYSDADNIYGVFTMIHNEGKYVISSDESEKKKWMKLVDRLSKKYYPYSITYNPTLNELNSYKTLIKDISLDTMSSEDSTNLENITFKSFEIMNFRHPSFSKIHTFSKVVQAKKSNFVENEQIIFSQYFSPFYDYIKIYNFYENYLISVMQNRKLNGSEIINLIEDAIKQKRSTYRDNQFVPNFLSTAEYSIYYEKSIASSYTSSYSTSYRRTLVPDFGYVGYVNVSSSTSLKGGSPFVGVNISLSPVNKNIPYNLSDLTMAQRFSIHTGVVLESVKETNVRDDFFSDFSLMLGGSYKMITQSTRINFGGILYNKIDPISGSKELAIQPYIGLSIDIEIRKWLSEFIPSLTENFKKP